MCRSIIFDKAKIKLKGDKKAKWYLCSWRVGNQFCSSMSTNGQLDDDYIMLYSMDLVNHFRKTYRGNDIGRGIRPSDWAGFPPDAIMTVKELNEHSTKIINIVF